MAALGQSAAMRHRASEAPLPAPLLLSPAGLIDAASRLASSDAALVAERRTALAQVIAQAVVPRLSLAHPGGRPLAVRPAAPEPSAADTTALLDALLRDDRGAATAQVVALQARGVAQDHLLLDLLAPAARWLGRAWEEDRCDFSTVTLGLLRLQQILRDCLSEPSPDLQLRPRRILLANPPGEQHTLGRDMLAALFRNAGWEVWEPAPRSAQEFGRIVARQRFDVVGISAGSSARLDSVAACVRMVRRSLTNRRAGVMVGGPLFNGDPGFVTLVGADASATDGRQAILAAERLLSLLACQD